LEKIDQGMTDRPVPLVTPAPDSTGQRRRQGKEEEPGRVKKRKPAPADESEPATTDDQRTTSDESADKGTRVDIQV